MSEYVTKVGKHLLELVMFQIYGDSEIIYREYIQNASDSIRQAVKENILQSKSEGMISVLIDKNKSLIRIEDNGTGIKTDKVLLKLLNIADSNKDGYEQAGQFGIGRLVGGGFCNEMKFITSAKGEDKKSILTIDTLKIRNHVNDENCSLSATEIMDECYVIEREDEQKDKHYFIVELKDFLKNVEANLLNEEVVVKYLQEVAPIDFSLPFKRSFFDNENKEFDKYRKELPVVQLSVNNRIDIRKGYGLKIEGTDDKIDSLEYIKIKDGDTTLGWGWYAVTPFSKAIKKEDNNRGIRLRRLNILVGKPDYLNKYFKEDRGNNYFYGEIYATHPDLKLNAPRTALAVNPTSLLFIEKLKIEFEKLQRIYYQANKYKNQLKEVKQIENSPSYDKNKKDESTKKLNKIEQNIDKNENGGVLQRVFSATRKQYDNSSTEKEKTPTTFLRENTNYQPSLETVLGKEKYKLSQQIFSLYLKYCGEKNRELITQLTEKVKECLLSYEQ